MARLVVVSSPALADGFRLAGCDTVAVPPGPITATVLHELVQTEDVGLLLVTADLWWGLDERHRGRLERLARPVVMPIPAGAATDGAVGGQLLSEMLQRAIGYRIQLSGGDR